LALRSPSTLRGGAFKPNPVYSTALPTWPGRVAVRPRQGTGLASDARGGSALWVTPAAPRPGATLRVRYRVAGPLASEPRLALRARLHTRRGEAYAHRTELVRLAILERHSGGLYEAAVRLPDSVVYASFAVEDLPGERVDSRGRQFWDVLVYGPNGRPLLDAYEQRENAFMERDWMEAYRTARRAATDYPDSLEAWLILAFYEGIALGSQAADSLRPAHRARFLTLESKLTNPARSGVPSPELTGAVMWYARSVAQDRVPFWRERLLATGPRTPWGVQERVVDLMHRTRSDSIAALGALEDLWREVGAAHPSLPSTGFRTALHVQDSTAAIARWGERILAARPEDSLDVAAAFARVAALRVRGMDWLRRSLASLGARRDAVRPLYRTAAEQLRADSASARVTLRILGDALLAAGDTAAARDTLELAATGGWDPALFRHVAALQRMRGDSGRAAALAAMVAVDPQSPAALIDSLRLTYAATDSEDAWDRRLRTAREAMRARTLAEAQGSDAVDLSTRSLPVEDTTGAPVLLRFRGSDSTTVVVFWSRHCGPALEALPQVVRLAPVLRAHGIRLVTFVEEEASADFRQFLATQGAAMPVYHDVRREASRAFAQSGTPYYYVVDPSGRVRFPYTTLEALLRQALALAGRQ